MSISQPSRIILYISHFDLVGSISSGVSDVGYFFSFLLQMLCFPVLSEEDSDNPCEWQDNQWQWWDSNSRSPSPIHDALDHRSMLPITRKYFILLS